MDNFYNEKCFINRDLSWIEFNKRVLEEASDSSNPLMERLKFLAITSSNFDEFFKIRVAGVKAQDDSNLKIQEISGMSPNELLDRIRGDVAKVVSRQYEIYNSIFSELEMEAGITIKSYSQLTEKELSFVEEYYSDVIFPTLTPMAVDQFHPLPNLNRGAIHIVLKIQKENSSFFAVVEVPTVIPRIISLPEKDSSKKTVILLEEIIGENISNLFKGFNILETGLFRVTRDEDLTLKDSDWSDDAEDLLKEIEKEIKNRKWGNPVRIECSENFPDSFKKFLKNSLNTDSKSFIQVSGPLDLTFLFSLMELGSHSHYFKKNLPKFYTEFKGDKLFSYLQKKDFIIRHPYESFEHVVDFLETAASDPDVLAIKQTLYRVSSGESRVIKALIKAAENGKQVTVLVELKARFDEERNLKWARQLEDAGCHVIYGVSGLKTHAKSLLIIRKETTGIKRYVQLGTGNYNDSTAKLYTDFSFFTTDEKIGEDISHLFNKLTGFSKIENWNKIFIAPDCLREGIYKQIDNEIQFAKKDKPAKIIIKVNGLTDKEIIEKLYDASKAGVKVILIVRGACCLKSGIKNISENIKVYSLVGRFLEHDRIYIFENGGNPNYFLSSADLMSRNLNSRIEILFPVEDLHTNKAIKKHISNILKDNCKLRIQNLDGTYSKINKKSGDKVFNSQEASVLK